MTYPVHRRPIAHFFVKKALQLRLIVHIVAAVILTTLVSLGCVALVYFIKYKTVIVYQLDKVTQDLSREHIIYLILPTLLVSALVNVVLAVAIGFYASRKYAIPIYKLEQWCSLLLHGKMGAMLHFREKEEMRELSTKCNELTNFFRTRFQTIKQQVGELRQSHGDSAPVKKIEDALHALDLSTEPIDVNTSFYKTAMLKEAEKRA